MGDRIQALGHMGFHMGDRTQAHGHKKTKTWDETSFSTNIG
jgi:hypothetical protein